MKKKLLIISLFLCLPIMVNATSGALKTATVKKCPNGKYYGQHGTDNHWHMAVSKNGKYYPDGEQLKGDPCKKVRIVFDPTAGTVSTKSKYSYVGYTYGTLPKPTRRGFDYSWYTAKSGGTKITASSKVDKARTLYARWGRHNYKITYVLNSGTNNKANPATYRVTDAVVLKNPVRKGAIFLGWYKDSKFKTKVTGISKGTIGNKTFYARWAAITYKITFNKNGGAGSMAAATGLKYNKVYTLRANAFKKTGYTFAGWNRKADGTGASFADRAQIKNLTATNGANVILYARWKAINYTITYNLDGGTNNDQNPSTYTINSTVNFLAPTKDGYNFLGWYSDSALTKRITSIARESMGNKTIYAKWGIKNLNINYHLNGGSNNSNNVMTFTLNDEVTLFDPVRRGYIFTGWYTDEGLVDSIIKIEKGTTRDVDLYAAWSPITYNINYYLDGGTNNVDNVGSYTVEDEVTLYEPSKDGFSFYGWYADLEFNDKVDIIEEGTIGDIDLYAKWGDIRYDITYNLDGGTNSSNNALQFTASDEISLSDPSKNGYNFLGWYTESTFVNKINKIEVGTSHDVDLYAKWEIIHYNINYHMGGGTNNIDNVGDYTIEDEVTLYNPTRNGFRFSGWHTEGFTGPIITGIEIGSTGVYDIYASWSPLTFNITYVMDGGTNDGNNPATFTSDDTIYLRTPTKEGYLFGGWYLDSLFTHAITEIEYGTDHDVTVYARWFSNSSNEDALASAVQHLKEQPYSRSYLAMILGEWENFSDEAVQYALNNCGANWNANAVSRLEELCDLNPFSIVKAEQALMNWEFFTEEEAEYACANADIDWDDNARRYAYNAIFGDIEPKEYVRDDLIAEMIAYGFSSYQAELGADWVESYL